MFMIKFFKALLATLLIPIIFTTSVAYVLNATVLDMGYLKKEANKTGFYKDFSELVPTQLSQMAAQSPAEQAQIKKMVTQIITPGVVQNKLEVYFAEFENHYKHNGPAPTLDLSDLVKQASAAGINIPTQDIQTSFTLPAETDAKLKQVFEGGKTAKTGTLITAGIMLCLLLLLSAKTHSYTSLVYVFVVSAILQGALFFGINGGVDVGIHAIRANVGESNALIDFIEKLGRTISHDISLQFAYLGVLFAVLAILFFGVATISHFRHKLKPLPHN
jgi:hypothetical protein